MLHNRVEGDVLKNRKCVWGIACAAISAYAASAPIALERGVDVDVTQFPLLSWTWKVSELPTGGDFRRTATDDQAAQVLVAFSDRRILTYIWDSSAPKGAWQSSSSVPLVHIFAL